MHALLDHVSVEEESSILNSIQEMFEGTGMAVTQDEKEYWHEVIIRAQ
jgi:hypothetical protein